MSRPLRVCIVYDCLYPWTVGGGERWYRLLAEWLARQGHDVTYVTRRQWGDDDPPRLPGVRVVAVSPGGDLYDEAGRRRTGPPLRFGRGVLGHLLRHRRRYDVVHCSAFPFFSLLAARLALAGTGVRVYADWLEVWSARYWRDYLGPVGGTVGYLVQRACARLSPYAFTNSAMTARQLTAQGIRTQPRVLPGLYTGAADVTPALTPPGVPLVLFAGRHIPEKRPHLVPAAIAAARRDLPTLRGLVLGDGPERPRVLEEIRRLGLEDVVSAPGFVAEQAVEAAFRTATCLLLPSEREGYGLVVVEASAVGTPSVVVAGPVNAAAELVEEDVNGFVATEADPEAMARAIARAHAGGAALRERTARWFADHVGELRVEASAEVVLEAYGAAGQPGRRATSSRQPKPGSPESRIAADA